MFRFLCLFHWNVETQVQDSKIIRQAQRKVVSLPELYRSFTYNSILAPLLM